MAGQTGQQRAHRHIRHPVTSLLELCAGSGKGRGGYRLTKEHQHALAQAENSYRKNGSSSSIRI